MRRRYAFGCTIVGCAVRVSTWNERALGMVADIVAAAPKDLLDAPNHQGVTPLAAVSEPLRLPEWIDAVFARVCVCVCVCVCVRGILARLVRFLTSCLSRNSLPALTRGTKTTPRQ